MFDNLSQKLDKAFKTLKGQGRITEINVATTAKEIRKALIDADVNYKVAKTVTDDIKEIALGREVLLSVSPGQLLVKITHEELARRLGESKLTVERIAMGIFSPEPKAAAYLTALWIVLTSKPIAFMPIRRKP